MLNPLFLITKGIKAKKKRLGGGGQPNPTILGIKTTASGAKAPPHLSSASLSIYNQGSGYITDSVTNRLLRRRSVDDYVANLNGLFYENGANGNTNVLDDGTTTLTASNASTYSVLVEAMINQNPTQSTVQEILNISVIRNTVNATINMVQQSSTIRYYQHLMGHRHGLVELEISPNQNYIAGEIIIKVHITGGGTDTDANVIAGTAQPSDAYYLKIIMT